MKLTRWIVLFVMLMTIVLMPFTAQAEVKINKKKVTIQVGETVKLKVTGTNEKVKWSSSNKKVATVSSKGKVTGKSAGKAVIKAKVNGKKYKCTVMVEPADLSDEDTVLIHIEHTGGFTARFYITWGEVVGYDPDEKPIYEQHAWDENGRDKKVGYTADITIPADAGNVCIKCEGATGMIWEQWKTNLDATNIQLSPQITVKIWGTTLDQKSSIEYGRGLLY